MCIAETKAREEQMPEGKRLVEKIHGGTGKVNPERAVKLIFAGVPKEYTDPQKYNTPTPPQVLQKIKDFAQKNNIG